MLHHGPTVAPVPPTPDATARAITEAVTRREKIASTCVSGADSGTFIVRRKHSPGEMTAVICSRSPELLETCLTSLRETAARVVKQIVVVAHEESGLNHSLRSVIKRAGAIALGYSGVFHFAAMNNLGADTANTPNLLFLNDDIRATQSEWAEILAEQVSREETRSGRGRLVVSVGRAATCRALWRELGLPGTDMPGVTRFRASFGLGCSLPGMYRQLLVPAWPFGRTFSAVLADSTRYFRIITTTWISASVFALGDTG